MHKHYRLCADTLRIRRVASVVAAATAAAFTASPAPSAPAAAAAYQKTKSAVAFLVPVQLRSP